MRVRAVAIVAATAVAAVSGCGGSSTVSKTTRSTFRVVLLSLRADSGYPAPATSQVAVSRVNGKLFARLARLVPMPLPAPLTARGRGETICVPVMLMVRLGDGHEHARRYVYRGCQRPPSLRPLLRAMCPLLRRPDLCARYRRELL